MNSSLSILFPAAPTGALPLYFPQVRKSAVEFLLGASTIALIALAAQTKVYTPFSEVPFTFQTLIVIGAGLVLGRRTATGAMAGYLALGIAGMPVFAGGNAGTGIFSGMTWGYLMAYPVAAYAVGRLATHENLRSPWRLAAIVVAGEAIIFGLGFAWMVALGKPALLALQTGVLVFLPWEAVKVALLAAALPSFSRAVASARSDAQDGPRGDAAIVRRTS